MLFRKTEQPSISAERTHQHTYAQNAITRSIHWRQSTHSPAHEHVLPMCKCGTSRSKNKRWRRRRRHIHTLSSVVSQSVTCENKSDTQQLVERIKRNSKTLQSNPPHPPLWRVVFYCLLDNLTLCDDEILDKKNIHLICKLEFNIPPAPLPSLCVYLAQQSRIPMLLALWPFVSRCSLKFQAKHAQLLRFAHCYCSIRLPFFSILALITTNVLGEKKHAPNVECHKVIFKVRRSDRVISLHFTSFLSQSDRRRQDLAQIPLRFRGNLGHIIPKKKHFTFDNDGIFSQHFFHGKRYCTNCFRWSYVNCVCLGTLRSPVLKRKKNERKLLMTNWETLSTE